MTFDEAREQLEGVTAQARVFEAVDERVGERAATKEDLATFAEMIRETAEAMLSMTEAAR